MKGRRVIPCLNRKLTVCVGGYSVLYSDVISGLERNSGGYHRRGARFISCVWIVEHRFMFSTTGAQL